MNTTISQPIYDKFFPDRIGAQTKTANDNNHEKGLLGMAGAQPEDLMRALIRAMQANQNSSQALMECMLAHHQVLEDHERRIIELEEMIDG